MGGRGEDVLLESSTTAPYVEDASTKQPLVDNSDIESRGAR